MPHNKDVTQGLPLDVKITGFIAFHTLFTLVIGVNIFFWSGLYYVRTIGAFLLFPYLTYVMVVDKAEFRDGRLWTEFARRFPLFSYARRFLAMEIDPLPKELKEAEAKPNAQFVFGFHPHGINSDYRVLMAGMLPDRFPNIAEQFRTLAASVLFRLPLVREISLWTGCVDARRSVAEKLLDKGRSLVLIPGGQAEQMKTTKGKELIYLAKRKGFIKLAMRKGVPVVPVYVFGCSDAYSTSQFMAGPRFWLMKNMGVSLPIGIGMLGSPLCPHPIRHTIVFGKPLTFRVEKTGSPTDDELHAAHSEYTEALLRLFDENKSRLGYGDRQLQESGRNN